MRLYQNKLTLYKDGKLYNIIMKHKEPEAPSSFVITYSVDSGNSKTSTINAGDSILNYSPTKDGYTFVGWRTDKTASNDVLSNMVATEATTLYAVFNKTVTASYNANGGSGSTSSNSGTMYYNNGNTLGATITLRSNGFSYTDRTFQKWASGSTSGTQYSAGATVTLTSDTTFYAVWKRTPISNVVYYSGKGEIGYTTKAFDTSGYTSVTVSLTVSSGWSWCWLYAGTTIPGTYTFFAGDTTHHISLPANSGNQSFGWRVCPVPDYGGTDENTSWEIRITAS